MGIIVEFKKKYDNYFYILFYVELMIYIIYVII